jgi:hypothetical protein
MLKAIFLFFLISLLNVKAESNERGSNEIAVSNERGSNEIAESKERGSNEIAVSNERGSNEIAESKERGSNDISSSNVKRLNIISAAITSEPTIVYDFYTQHCPPLPQPGCSSSIAEGCDCDTADAPMRFWRRTDPISGEKSIFSLASVDLGSRGFGGDNVLDLEHYCSLYANSSRIQNMASFANYEWIHSSVYFPGNNSVYALTHMEWDCKGQDTCAFYSDGYSFFTGVTLLESINGGNSWSYSRPLPEHLVAASPIKWNETIGAIGQTYGFRSPSGIVAGRGALSGFYYATVTAGWGFGQFQGQIDGACMMQTRDVTDPTSWRAWGGSAFNISLNVNPWFNKNIIASDHICVPFTNMTYASLLWSTFYNQYLYFGTTNGNDHGGWSFYLSTDLISFSGPYGPIDPGNYIIPAGNASVTPNGKPFTGRFVQRQDHLDDPQVWYEDDSKTFKTRVGSCTPCPKFNACNCTLIPDTEFDSLEDRGTFTCDPWFKSTGYSDYYYPTLVDPNSLSDNFDEVGESAVLFLVGQRCVGGGGMDANGNLECTPFDENGLLVRDLLRVNVQFQNVV